MDEIDDILEENPSLGASELSHYDPEHHRGERSPFFGIPSTHSGFRSGVSEASEAESASESQGPWSPPAWRKAGSGWYRRQLAHSSPSHSRHGSPEHYESAGEGDITVAAKIPLPESPLKLTPRSTPEPGIKQENMDPSKKALEPVREEDETQSIAQSENGNLFHFKQTAELRYQFKNLSLLDYFRRRSFPQNLFTFLLTLLSAVLLRRLFTPPAQGPVPDLVKVAGLANSFEPLIYYSENGAQQIGDLHNTGVAVWDLGESVRSTNMTSAPIIVRELDELSDSIKMLSVELTKFFASVDGDVDAILIVMEWAKRELAHVSTLPSGTFDSVFGNIHGALCRVGILEDSNGNPTTAGLLFSDLFGQTNEQRTKNALQKTFNEFLNILEESINNELEYSSALFGLFEAIERQFLNLQRTVVRETDSQDREEEELLSSLWTRVMGANASRLKKFEKNRLLLATLREKTVRNKSLVVEYNGRLMQLKSNLEILRRKLISPLVRSNDSSTLSVDEQIRGLDGTYSHLKEVRESQKRKVLERVYGAGSRYITVMANDAVVNEIEGR